MNLQFVGQESPPKQSDLWKVAMLTLLIPCLLIGWPTVGHAEHTVHLYNDLSVTANDISGAGDSQSSLTEGRNYLEVVTLNGRGELGEYTYRFNLGAKSTDDQRIDIQQYSLTNLQGQIGNRIHTLTAGDAFNAFSQYSLNTAVKGGSYRYANPKDGLPEVTVLSGVAVPRWDNLWGLDAVQRDVFGARIKQRVNEDFWLAASFVQSDDSDRVAGASLFATETLAVDWEYLPIPGLTIRGESAFNDTSESTADGVADLEKNGYAHQLEAIGDGGPSRVVLQYERVSPDFLALLGSATADREKAKGTWRYKYTRTLILNFGMLWYRDNLDGDLAYRTDHYRPELGVTRKNIFQRRYAVADLTYKYDRASGGEITTKDHYVNLGYRDRFGIFDSDTNLGGTVYSTDPSRDSDEYIYNTTLSFRHTTGMFVLKPSLRLGGWDLADDLADTHDRIWEYSLGLGLDVPEWKVTSHWRVGQNKLDKDDGVDNTKSIAGANIYYRPGFLAMFDYGQLYLRALVNDFSYSEGNRDFRENSVTAGIIIRY